MGIQTISLGDHQLGLSYSLSLLWWQLYVVARV